MPELLRAGRRFVRYSTRKLRGQGLGLERRHPLGVAQVYPASESAIVDDTTVYPSPLEWLTAVSHLFVGINKKYFSDVSIPVDSEENS